MIAIVLDAMARFDWVKVQAQVDSRLEREDQKMVAMSKSGIVAAVGGAIVESGDWNAGTVLANRQVVSRKSCCVNVETFAPGDARNHRSGCAIQALSKKGKRREKTSLYF